MAKSKILIFGGSFDPPHKEHSKMLKTAINFCKPDKTYVFTSFHTPLKDKSQTSARMRFEMAKIAFGDINPNVVVHPYEINKKRKTYAWQLVKYVKSKHPHTDIFMLMGCDCIAKLKKWKNYRFVLENTNLLVAKRKGFPIKKTKKADYEILPKIFEKTSSSEIRHKIMLSGKVPKKISAKVARFVSKHGLYAVAIHKWLKKKLGKQRYYHTVCSAGLSSKLAEIHRQDKTACIEAALLHDCAKGLSNTQLVHYVCKNDVEISMRNSIIRNQPSVLHSFVSADMARKKFAIQNKKILLAIANHTLGDIHMDDISKIIYVADISSPDRRQKVATEIRNVAFENLDNAVILALKAKLFHVLEKNKWLCLHSVNLWNKLIKS